MEKEIYIFMYQVWERLPRGKLKFLLLDVKKTADKKKKKMLRQCMNVSMSVFMATCGQAVHVPPDVLWKLYEPLDIRSNGLENHFLSHS